MYSTQDREQAEKVARENGEMLWKCPDDWYIVNNDCEAVNEQDEEAVQIFID